MQIFFDKVQSVFVDPEDGIKQVKRCIEVCYGCCCTETCLVYDRTLSATSSVVYNLEF